jgi:hypothetical protein
MYSSFIDRVHHNDSTLIGGGPFEPFCQFLVGLSDSAHPFPRIRVLKRLGFCQNFLGVVSTLSGKRQKLLIRHRSAFPPFPAEGTLAMQKSANGKVDYQRVACALFWWMALQPEAYRRAPGLSSGAD